MTRRFGFASCLFLATIGTASADDVNCATFPGHTITGYVNDKVIANDGIMCTVSGPGAFVNADIEATDTAVRVMNSARVDGNIKQEGTGGVQVSGANVNGKIEEKGAGAIQIRLAAGNHFNGDVVEEDGGNVTIVVALGASFNGNANEKGGGNLTTEGAGSYNGNTKEEDAGVCGNAIVAFNGKACD